MYSYYKKYAELPVFDDTIQLYSLKSTQKGLDNIFENHDITDWDLDAESGLSRYHIYNLKEGKTGPRPRVWDVYIASKIIDNPKYKRHMIKMKKITLVHPLHLKRVCREVGMTVPSIHDFTKGMFSEAQITRAMNHKQKTGLKFDLAVGITAMYFHLKNNKPKINYTISSIKNPNTRKRMIYNDRVERYRSGYLPPVQQKTGKAS